MIVRALKMGRLADTLQKMGRLADGWLVGSRVITSMKKREKN